VIETAVPNPVAADLDGDGKLEVGIHRLCGEAERVAVDAASTDVGPDSVLGLVQPVGVPLPSYEGKRISSFPSPSRSAATGFATAVSITL